VVGRESSRRPDLFAREFHDTLERIRSAPGSGIAWPIPTRPNLRRILMARTQNHIFFVVDEKERVIDILALWGAARKRAPRP
jgi:hypothetical protein